MINCEEGSERDKTRQWMKETQAQLIFNTTQTCFYLYTWEKKTAAEIRGKKQHKS